jgi:tetratricopeptide (TPR) repeat protein
LIFSLGFVFYKSDRFADAEGMFRKVLELAPAFIGTHTILGMTLLAEGKPEAALATVQQEVDEGDRLLLLPVVLQANGRSSEADGALEAQIARSAGTSPYYVAMNYAYRGDHDLALQWLERAYEQRDHSLVEIVGEPLFKNIADDPRYKTFLRKMKLPG